MLETDHVNNPTEHERFRPMSSLFEPSSLRYDLKVCWNCGRANRR